jgi:hypothetical protein
MSASTEAKIAMRRAIEKGDPVLLSSGLEEPQTAAGPHVARWRPDTNQTAIDPNDGLYAAPATLGTVDRGISVISVKTQSVAKEMPFPGIEFGIDHLKEGH